MLYHIRISNKLYPNRTEYNFDITKEQLENRFLNKLNQGKDFVINGKTIQLKDIKQIEIFETQKKSIMLDGPKSFSLETHELVKKIVYLFCQSVVCFGKNSVFSL